MHICSIRPQCINWCAEFFSVFLNPVMAQVVKIGPHWRQKTFLSHIGMAANVLTMLLLRNDRKGKKVFKFS